MAEEQQGTPQTRDAVLAPRIGFNGAQDLAVYGDTVPLVYTNTAQNGNGGVRVASLLLWSAILSFGNNQFMRLMMTIGASSIARIDPERTALGQFPARDLVFGNVWQYYSENGPTRYQNLIKGGGTDPTIRSGIDTTARLTGLPGDAEGFSQAFSPTTANAVGVTGFIPIEADVLILNEAGNSERRRVEARFQSRSGAYWPDNGNRPFVPVGDFWELFVGHTIELLPTTDTAGIARQDALRDSASRIDNGTIFKAGSALFRVVSVSFTGGSNGIEEGDLYASVECIRTGKLPRANYGLEHWQDVGAQIKPLQAKIDARNGQIASAEQVRNTNQAILNRGYVTRTSTVQNRVSGSYNKPLTQADRDNYQSSINTLNNRIATLQNQNNALQNQINSLQGQGGPEAFHVKGLARVEEAAYASVTKCDVLDIALRFQAYRRLSGRANVYGKDQVNYGHSASDNGAKARTAMFAVWYRLDNAGDYIRLPYIFCCRGVNEQETFTYLKLITRNAGPRFIGVKLEAVVDTYTEIRTFHTRGYCYLNATGPLVTLGTDLTENGNLEVYYNGSIYRDGDRGDYPPFNKSPANTTEWDLFNYDAFSNTSFSFDSSTEIKITAVTEQRIESWASYNPNLYGGLSTLALHVVSGAGTQDLRSVSAYVTEGKRVRLLPANLDYFGNEATGSQDDGAITAFANSGPSNSTSFAPDIFLDTILDDINGIGQYASLHSVDVMQLAQSKRYCQRNRLFMDGIIADGRPWREFWAQVAPFSLLELGKIGGKETLVPALPYIKSSGRMTRNVSITALFNQGNILEDTFKEEFIDYGASVQDVIVTLIYRDTERGSVFPRNNSVEVKRTDTQEANAIRESLDISQFVTTRAQSILLGKYLCNIRRYNRRAIEFMTFPTDIFVMPGSYVYVETSNNQWDGIYTGRIEDGGIFNVPLQGIPNGTYNVLTYGSTDGTRSFNGVAVSNGAAPALASRRGDLFVLGQAVRSKRVFRVTEVTMEEEGETTVRAVEHPCDANGQSLIAEGIASYVAGLFTIDGAAETESGEVVPVPTRITTANQIYTTIAGVSPSLLSLDIYHFGTGATENRPVIIYIHGGAWAVGDKASINSKASFFNNLGYIFVSINYRLSPLEAIPYSSFSASRVKHPNHVTDCATALGWIYSNIGNYGGDESKLVLAGHSAGAQLASLLATNQSYLSAAGVTINKIKGCISVDTEGYNIYKQISETVSGGEAGAMQEKYIYQNAFGIYPDASIAGTPTTLTIDFPNTATALASYATASPVSHVSGTTPSFLVFTRGDATRIARTGEFTSALQSAAVPTKLVTYPGSTTYTHQEINTSIGATNDPPVGKSLPAGRAQCHRAN
jgi:arylformamidase